MRTRMNGRWIVMSVLVVLLLLALAGGLIQAQGPEPPEEEIQSQEKAGVMADVGSRIPIQGRLTDANGSPLSGTYSIRFRLYDAATEGIALCEDTNSVNVENGLFYSEIWGDCGSDDMNGQQLYLGIKVGADDEMTDRQAIYPVPYAMSLRPGARIYGDVGGSALWVDNTQSTGNTSGVHGRAASPDGYGGYFDNDGGGYALGVGGGMEMTVNATGVQPIGIGDRYRDNAIIAWANVNSNGTIGWDFGVTQIIREGVGTYLIQIDADTTGTSSFIPIAIAEVNTAPDSADDARIVAIQQVNQGIFRVFISNGNWNMVDNQFLFLVTGR